MAVRKTYSGRRPSRNKASVIAGRLRELGGKVRKLGPKLKKPSEARAGKLRLAPSTAPGRQRLGVRIEALRTRGRKLARQIAKPGEGSTARELARKDALRMIEELREKLRSDGGHRPSRLTAPARRGEKSAPSRGAT